MCTNNRNNEINNSGRKERACLWCRSQIQMFIFQIFFSFSSLTIHENCVKILRNPQLQPLNNPLIPFVPYTYTHTNTLFLSVGVKNCNCWSWPDESHLICIRSNLFISMPCVMSKLTMLLLLLCVMCSIFFILLHFTPFILFVHHFRSQSNRGFVSLFMYKMH